MYSVSWGAVRRRRPQALMVFVLAAIAVSAAAAGPWYGTTVASRAAGARVAAAPPAQHTIVVHRTADLAGDPRGTLDAFAGSVRGLLTLPGAEPRLGLAQDMTYPDPRRALSPAGLPVAYRDDFCDHARLTGSCPDVAGEVAISTAAAARLKVITG